MPNNFVTKQSYREQLYQQNNSNNNSNGTKPHGWSWHLVQLVTFIL